MLRRKFIGLIGALAVTAVISFGGAPSYYPPALGDFDSTNDYLNRGSDLTGNADGKTGIFSGWVRLDGSNGSTQTIVQSAGGFFNVYRLSGNTVSFVAYDDSPALRLSIASVQTITSGSGWHHILASWDLANTTTHLYIDDVETNNETLAADAVLDYTRGGWIIGRKWAGGDFIDGGISELYFNTAEYLDFSVEANRRLFIDANGNPVDLGPSGYKPTGTAPIAYFRTQFNNCGLNSGTGGDFVIKGAPTYTMGPMPFPLTTWRPGGAQGRGGRGGRAAIH